MNRGRRFVLPALVVALLVFVVYPLSIGPAVWLQRHGYLGPWLQKAYGTFYGPLSWMVVQFEVCRRFADWYIAFWVD